MPSWCSQRTTPGGRGLIVAFKWDLENEYGFEKQGEGGRREGGILGGGSRMHKTMETGELKLC